MKFVVKNPPQIMKIAVAGTGYVGLSMATLLAQHNEVIAVDIMADKVEKINRRKSPIQDDYIEEYFANKELHLTATLDAEAAYKDTEDWFKDKDFKSGRDYRCGWLWGSYDADIYECIYISGNLIISAYLKYSNNYYEEGDETRVTSATRRIDKDDYIESEWGRLKKIYEKDLVVEWKPIEEAPKTEAPKKTTRKRTTKKAEAVEGEEPAKKTTRKRTTRKAAEVVAETPVEE